MDGLNEAARRLFRARNQPEVLIQELSPLYAVVYVQGTRILGLGTLKNDEIYRVYVDPSTKNRGAGSAIMAALEDEARCRGLGVVHVQSSPNAESFYRDRSYHTVRCESGSNGDATFTYVCMTKHL